MVDELYFASLCRQILNEDPSIRFVGIIDRHGHLVATAYRKGLVPLMNKEETEKYAIHTVIRASMRETFAANIGKLQYAVGIYGKLIRATVPIAYGANSNNKFYLLMSFDRNTSDVNAIIENRVLPRIEENKDYFL